MTMPPVYIFSYNRAETITTHKLFPNAAVVLHSEEERTKYRAAGLKNEIIVTGQEPGLYGKMKQHKAICEKKKTGWAVFCDDDIEGINKLPEDLYKWDYLPVEEKNAAYWNKAFAQKANPCAIEQIILELQEEAERAGASYAGLAYTKNYFYRVKKYRYISLVPGAFTLQKTENMRHDVSYCCEDVYYTKDHLLRYGKVVVNYFAAAITGGFFNTGGLGKKQERINAYFHDTQRIVEEQPGLFAYRNDPDMPPKTDTKIIIHNQRDLERWRAKYIHTTGQAEGNP